MTDVVIDTDAAVPPPKGDSPCRGITRHLISARVWLTFVTVGELAKWVEIRNWGELARRRMDSWIGQRPVIPYDPGIARTWGCLAASAQQRGRPRPQNDTWIAACCVRHNVPLITLNTKDFTDFAAHDGLVLLPEAD